MSTFVSDQWRPEVTHDERIRQATETILRQCKGFEGFCALEDGCIDIVNAACAEYVVQLQEHPNMMDADYSDDPLYMVGYAVAKAIAKAIEDAAEVLAK